MSQLVERKHFVFGVSTEVAAVAKAKIQQTTGRSGDVGKWVRKVLSNQKEHDGSSQKDPTASVLRCSQVKGQHCSK